MQDKRLTRCDLGFWAPPPRQNVFYKSDQSKYNKTIVNIDILCLFKERRPNTQTLQGHERFRGLISGQGNSSPDLADAVETLLVSFHRESENNNSDVLVCIKPFSIYYYLN